MLRNFTAVALVMGCAQAAARAGSPVNYYFNDTIPGGGSAVVRHECSQLCLD